MPSKYAPCKKSCCWSPQGVCGRKRVCPCHLDAQLAAKDEGNFNPSPKPAVKPAANVAPLFKEP